MSIQAKEKGASFQSADRKRTLGVGRALEPSREDGELSPRDVNSWWRKRHQEPDHHFVQIVMVRHPNPNPARFAKKSNSAIASATLFPFISWATNRTFLGDCL